MRSQTGADTVGIRLDSIGERSLLCCVTLSWAIARSSTVTLASQLPEAGFARL